MNKPVYAIIGSHACFSVFLFGFATSLRCGRSSFYSWLLFLISLLFHLQTKSFILTKHVYYYTNASLEKHMFLYQNKSKINILVYLQVDYTIESA